MTGLIYETAKQLIAEGWNREPLRLIGLSLTDIDRENYEQLSFLKDERKERLKKLDTAIDAIREKYGNFSIQRASTLETEKKVARKYKAQLEDERNP